MAIISSFRKQGLLLEFSSLKAACPEGVYVTLTPGDASLWSGVVFVRSGPYSPAVLRFHLSFPPHYPTQPPLVTFSTEIFHPLLTPLTTQTYATAAAGGGIHADEECLPPGGFSLRHGFPQWFGHRSSGFNEVVDVPVFSILDYIRAAFNDADLLSSIPLELAANPGAYHAWHTYREEQQAADEGRQKSRRLNAARDTASKPRRPGEWNWQGVWEQRVRKGVQESLSEPMLFGSANSIDEIIRFFDLDEEAAQQVMGQILKRAVTAERGDNFESTQDSLEL